MGPYSGTTVKVSLVLPVYNERANVAELVDEIRAAFAGRTYEIVAVDDRSRDGSLDELRRLASSDDRVRVVSLARHQGQSAALAAGWTAARGEVVVTLDADGQNDPADAPRLVDLLREDPTLAGVAGIRTGRRDSPWKLAQSRVANTVRNWITGDRLRDTGCGLKAFRSSALVRLPLFDGMHRFLPTLVRMQGGRVIEVPVLHRPRRSGRSKYGMWNRVFRGLRDAFGVRWLARRALHVDADEELD